MKRAFIPLSFMLAFASACSPSDENASKQPAALRGDAESGTLRANAVVESSGEPDEHLWAEAAPEATADDPEKALAITDPNVVQYGARVRLTAGTWAFLRLTMRDMFKQWGSPQRDAAGMNLLLDPGYNYETKSAGPLRTTPFQRYWAHEPGFTCAFADCNGTNLYRAKPNSAQWLQVRKWGAAGSLCNQDNTINGNMRGLRGGLQATHRQHGFYITKDGQCYTEINVCTPNSSQSDISTPHVGHDSGQTCTLAAIDADILGIYAEINLGAFVFPHGGIESKRTPLEPYDPPDLGTYTGFTSRYGMRGLSSRTVSTGCNWYGACGGSTAGWAWAASSYPSSAANYDPLFQHHKDTGSYFRQGDDQAVYLNIGQMQIQSLLRGGASDIWYQLRDIPTNNCLSVSGGVAVDDAAIVLETCSTALPAAPRQMFQFDYTNNTIRSRLGSQDKCISFSAPADGALVRLFGCAGNATHITSFERDGDRYRNVVDSYAVSANTDTLVVDQRVYTSDPNQQWEFVDTQDQSSYWRWLIPDQPGSGGRCTQVNASNQLHHEPCAETLSQFWIRRYLVGTTGDFEFRSAMNFNQCMHAASAGNGNLLTLVNCNNSNNQRWFQKTNRGIYWRANTSYCMNADTGSANQVQLYSDGLFTTHCDSGPPTNERWTLAIATINGQEMFAFGWFRERATNKCLRAVDAALANGSTVDLAVCAVNNYQQWQYDSATDYIRLKQNTNKCLDHGGVHTPGAALRIYDCGGARNAFQRFDRSGEALLVRNSFFLTAGVAPPGAALMREYRNDESQLFEQINDKTVVITYESQMHDCGDFAGKDKVYSGQIDANNEPVYFDALTPQCLRPKSYWHGPPNICPLGCTQVGTPKERWTPCDPFDTYLADGIFNPSRDDNFLIYPSPFGGQTRTCGVANSVHDPGNAGWYGLKVDSLVLRPDSVANWNEKNSIELTLSTKDLHIELGFWVDANLTGGVSFAVSDPKRRWALINARLKELIARPRIKLYSIDSSSCGLVDGACGGFWNPYNNQLTDPDRLIIDVQLGQEDIDLNLDNPSFEIVSAPACFVSVLGICALTSASLMETVMGQLAPVIKDVLIPMIDDAVRGAVESLPNLNDVLGNPMNLGRTLIDVGLYATPEHGVHLPDPAPPEPGKRWPVRIFGGAAAGQEITDLRFAIGMKPLAFNLPPANNPGGFVTVDTNDPPGPNAVYGVPTLVNPDTSSCFNAKGSQYTHTRLLAGTYSYNNSTGVMTFTSYAAGIGGTYADVRPGYVIRNTANNETAKVIAVTGSNRVTLPAGMSTKFGASGNFAIDIGVISAMTFTQGAFGNLVAGQVFGDDSTGKFAKIIEIRTVGRLLLDTFSTSDFNRDWFTVLNCSRPSRYPAPDEDQQVDNDDYVVTGSFTDPHTGIIYAAPRVIPEYWKGPIEKTKMAPQWCSSPQELRQFSTPAQMNALYPQTSWLSFDSTYDRKATGQPAGPRNTVGEWSRMPAGTVLRQNYNDGSMEPNPVGYDFSVHLHQRTIANLLQSLVASGAACLEFAAQDETGSDTPWKSMLATERFAAFMPDLRRMFPKQHVSVRVFPTRAPHIRTGIGRLSYTPMERLTNPNNHDAPLPIVNERYTLGMALPDLRIEFWVQDPVANTELRVMSMYWNTVLGFFAKNIRKCFHLDPLANSLECTSSQVNERTVSGYYELFFDLNSPSLQADFENARDGFATGSFSTPGIGSTRGEAAIVIDSTICSSGDCNMLAFSQSVPTLLSSMLQIFLVTRLQFMDMTLDFLYVGADGPNDDNVPAGATGRANGGDYLGIYAKLIGNLNVFDLLGSVNLAPGSFNRLPYVTMGGFEHENELVFNSNSPVIPVSLIPQGGGGNSVDSYTYSVNDGFWHTPVTASSVKLGVLTEGEHKLSIRVINDSLGGATAQRVATELRFRVDTLAPEITIGSLKGWGWNRHVPVSVFDLQTPANQISAMYSVDGGKSAQLKGDIPLSSLSRGRNVVRVTAFDLAGNQASLAKEIHVSSSGCATSQPGGLFLLIGALGILAARRRWSMRMRS
jgi:hypothetical protein